MDLVICQHTFYLHRKSEYCGSNWGGRSMIYIFYMYRKMKIIQLATATPGNWDEEKEEMDYTIKVIFHQAHITFITNKIFKCIPVVISEWWLHSFFKIFFFVILCIFSTVWKLKRITGTSLAVRWLRLCISTAGGTGSVPSQGTNIPHVAQDSPPPKKCITTC